MLMQMIPSAEAIGQGDCETSRTIGVSTFVTRVACTHPRRSPGFQFAIGRLEDEIGKASSEMDDVFARAAGDFEDDALCRQDITKDAEHEIAVAQCCGGVLPEVVHPPRIKNSSSDMRPRSFTSASDQ